MTRLNSMFPFLIDAVYTVDYKVGDILLSCCDTSSVDLVLLGA